MQGDEWQTVNIDGEQGNTFAVKAAWDAGRLAVPLGQCKGHVCSDPIPAVSLPRNGSLACYPPAPTPVNKYLGSFNFIVDPLTKAVGIKGWAVDLSTSLPGKKNGTEPVTVQLRVNGKFGLLPPQVASIPNPNLPERNPNIPDPAHAFKYKKLPNALMKGTQKFVLFGQIGASGPLHALGGAPGKGIKLCLCDGAACPCP